MRVIQVLGALIYGDGVSNDAIHIHDVLDNMHIENMICAKYLTDEVVKYVTPLEQYIPHTEDILIYHFSGKSCVSDFVDSFPGQVIMRYHNITPPAFFADSNPALSQACAEGIEEAKQLVKRRGWQFWADSPFNAADLIRYGAAPDRVSILPVFMDLEHLKDAKYNEALQQELKQVQYILYVGRIAQNKRIEDILDTFEYYHRFHNDRVQLKLVGNNSWDASYTKKLMEKLSKLSCREQVCFTGKANEDVLYTYYRNASAFLCMSEHEGFGVSLIEAMCFDIPVVAYDSCAISDTMGGSGVLLRKKNPAQAANILSEIVENAAMRESIIKAQRENLKQYMKPVMEARLEELLKRGMATNV